MFLWRVNVGSRLIRPEEATQIHSDLRIGGIRTNSGVCDESK
jgi:hypothetical protein